LNYGRSTKGKLAPPGGVIKSTYSQHQAALTESEEETGQVRLNEQTSASGNHMTGKYQYRYYAPESCGIFIRIIDKELLKGSQAEGVVEKEQQGVEREQVVPPERVEREQHGELCLEEPE